MIIVGGVAYGGLYALVFVYCLLVDVLVRLRCVGWFGCCLVCVMVFWCSVVVVFSGASWGLSAVLAVSW